jgi:hypothetical protein
MAILAALSFLAVLSAFGIVLLRRVAPVLNRLESIAYGAPLGATIGSLIVLLTARFIGLAAGTIVVAVIALAVALIGVIGRWGWAGLRVRTRGRQGARLWRLLSRPSVLIPTLVIGLILARWTIFWLGSLEYEGTTLVATHVNVFGDLPVHLSYASAFAYGENFPPEHPRFAGRPHAYHHLTDLTAAALVPLGLDPAAALTLHNLVFSVFVLLAILAMMLRLTRDGSVATLAVVLFTLGGSLAWMEMVGRLGARPDPLAGRLWEFEAVGAAGYQWVNTFYGFLMPQRAFLYGMPLAFLSLTLVLIGHRRRNTIDFVIAGAVLGLLPLAHLSTMLAMALVTPCLVLLFPSRRWVPFFAAWILVAVPQLFLQQGGGAGALSFLRVQLGWVMGETPWPIFWLKQVGLFLPLVLVALALPRLLPRDSYRLLLAFMAIFVVANIVVFQPWDWDNHKYFVYWFFATSVLVASLLVWAWRRYGPVVRVLTVAVVLTMVGSYALEDANQLLGRDRYPMFTGEDLELAAQVRNATPPRSVFVAGPVNNHPVASLTGRRVMMGFTGWLFAEGLPWEERDADVRAIYAYTDDAERLLDEYDIDYVVIGPFERDALAANVDAYRQRYRSVISTPSYEVFAIGG